MILGGSNSGPKNGWASDLAKLAPEHSFDNKFLGAVGSLFGLLRLLKMARDGAERPDLVIFEYTLNDTVWMAGESLNRPLVADTLHDVLTFCAREKIRFLFLCLCLRPPEGRGEAPGSLFLDEIYRSVAKARAADCLFLAEILGRIDVRQFVDHKHLDAASSRRVAEAVAARLRKPVAVPRGAERGMSYCYLDADQASVEGAARRLRHSATVFEGPFVELSRGGKCFFETDGRLAALLVRPTERSGAYRIRAGREAFRKNAQSLARGTVSNLIILHYVVRSVRVAGRVEIDMPESEAALMALPDDLTLMEGPPHIPFEEQTLEIAGIMVYRPRPVLRRALDALFAR